MSHFTFRGPSTASSHEESSRRFCPSVEQLDDRTLLSTSTLISRQPVDPSGVNPFAGVDARVDILGASDDGQFLLLQTAATNFSKSYDDQKFQITPPGQTNLFWYDVTSERAYLVSALDPGSGFSSSAFAAGQKSLGVEVSTRDKLNAVISSDGQKVAFLSSANAFYFDSKLTNGLASDGGGTDLFLWDSNKAKTSQPAVTLVSRTFTGVAIGGAGRISNPTIAPDGSSVSFVSTAPAYDIVNNNVILPPANKRVEYTNVNKVVGNYPLNPQLDFNTQDYLLRDTSDSPDLFRAVPGTTPTAISYDQVELVFGVRDITNGKLIPQTEYRYAMMGNIKVDDLNRYSTSGNALFGVIRDWSIYYGANAKGNDAWRFTFNPAITLKAGQQPLDPVTRSNLTTAKDQLTIPGLNGLGDTFNVITAQGSGDFYFLYKSIGKTTNGFLLGNYVSNNNNDYEIYRSVGGSSSARPELLTNQAQSTNIGANGLLDLSTPASYQVTLDGAKIVFTSTATNLVTGLVDDNLAFDVFQRDLTANPTTGGQTFAMSVRNNNRLRTGDAEARYPTQTPDGLAVSFESIGIAFTTVPDSNNATDIFVRDIIRGQTLLASSTDSNASTPNAKSYGAIVTRTANLDRNFYRNFLVYYSSEGTNIDPDYKVDAGLAQVYRTPFPIFISTLTKAFSYSDGQGNVYMATTSALGKVVTSAKYTPIPGWRGELRVATGDFNGDNIPDMLVGTGPGGGPRVVVIDGFNGRVLEDFFAFERSFTGGVYVAAGDFTGDGKADIVVGAGEGGAPRVQIYDSLTGIPLMDFFAYESTARTGVRVAVGDFNGDNVNDLYIAAGIGGGPRVRVFDGTKLPTPAILTDFFAFESTLRGGAYLSAGDFDGDGLSDIVVGAGPEGGPRVTIFNAANLNLRDPNQLVTFSDFFAFDPNLRTGVRPILRNIDSDKYGDLIVGLGAGLPQIRTYTGTTIRETGDPVPKDDIFAGGSLFGQNGAWVG